MKMTRAPFNMSKFWYKNIKKIIVILFVFSLSSGCLPGINKNVKNQKSKELLPGNYSINDIAIDIIKLDNLNENQINNFNSSKVKELKYSINEFPKIYNYQYAYALDTSDVISIDLTDTDDIDGTYTIDPDGNIDLPFVDLRLRVIDLFPEFCAKKLIPIPIEFELGSDPKFLARSPFIGDSTLITSAPRFTN